MPLANPDLPAPAQEELNTLVSQITMLDPNGNGITANQLRVFYPREGWKTIYHRLYSLVDAGTLARRLRGSPVPLEYFYIPPAGE